MTRRNVSSSFLALTSVLTAVIAASAFAQGAPADVQRAGTAIDVPRTEEPGDAARGRIIVLDRNLGGWILCHALPDTEVAGNLGHLIAGGVSRLSVGDLRSRLVDSSRHNLDTVMPAYNRTGELNRVAGAFRDKPILSAQQIDDVVAHLRTLK